MDCIFYSDFDCNLWFNEGNRSDIMKKSNIWKKDKRGGLTTRQIVILTILIVSFIIILFLIFRLGLGEETKKHNWYQCGYKDGFGSFIKI